MLKIDNQMELDVASNHELYRKLLPEHHKLRKILKLTDFYFIIDELKDNYCLDTGRNATDPILLFNYLMLKVIYKLSDVDLVERTSYDLSFKFFLGWDPLDTQFINPATVSKVRRKDLIDDSLMSSLIGKTTEIANDKNLIKSKSIIVDSTHTGARYNLKSPIEVLMELANNLRTNVYSYNEDYIGKFPKNQVME